MKNENWVKYLMVFVILMSFRMITSCNLIMKKKDKKSSDLTFYTGTSSGAESDGIYKISMDKAGHFKKVKKAAKTDSPSFLAYGPDKRVLINVNEHRKNNGMGTVESWEINEDTLRFISKSSSGGAHPCFVSSNDSGYVVVTNYSGGNVGLLKLNANGKLSELLDVHQHKGDSVSPRQDAPHAHSAWFEPDGTGIIAADLGTNELWFYQIDQHNKKLVAKPPFKLAMAPGAGPRHLAFHPNKKWYYVLKELNSTITRIHKKSNGEYVIEESIPTLPDDFSGENLCAHILVSSDGRLVYASNRGHNSIAIFEVDQETGKLEIPGHASVRGNWPRHFALSPNEDFLVVANRWSGNLVSFKRDAETGLLKFVDEVKIANPVCVLF
jgi:6-phosphogluconolactonase